MDSSDFVAHILETTDTTRPQLIENILGLLLIAARTDPDIDPAYTANLSLCHALALEEIAA